MDIKETFKNMNDQTIVGILLVIIVTIIIGVILYYVYIINLKSNNATYINNTYGTIAGSIHSINKVQPSFKYTLNDYYIKGAYNCCSAGTYKNDYVDLAALKACLKQGVRCLDFEIFSIEDKAVVATSTTDSYFVKETYNSIDFSEVMKTLINYAFSSSGCPNPGDPLILHLRIKSSNQKMYTDMANIFKGYNNYLLGEQYSYENHKKNLGNVPLLDLLGKIIIVVDGTNKAYLDNKEFYEFVNMTSNSVFCRALHYYDIKYTPDVNELINFNKQFMTIAMPDKGADPENPSGVVMRETGCQMLAMRYQTVDANLEEMIQFFDNAGTAFVLKPENLRYKPETIPEPPKQDPKLSYATRNIESDYYKFEI